jgi:[ribosomal protein S5]-alanine N-acetyltransferase
MSLPDDFPFPEFPILKTKRLHLREVTLSDDKDVFVFRSDAYVQRFNSKPIENVSEAREQITRMKATYERTDGIGWGITLKEQDTVIGMVGFWQWSYSNRAMLGYDLAREYWGKGIANEAVREIIRFGYEKMELNRIEAETIEDNHESRRMLEKIGFVLEGIRREYSLENDGKYHGSAMYALLKSEYKSSK